MFESGCVHPCAWILANWLVFSPVSLSYSWSAVGSNSIYVVTLPALLIQCFCFHNLCLPNTLVFRPGCCKIITFQYCWGKLFPSLLYKWFWSTLNTGRDFYFLREIFGTCYEPLNLNQSRTHSWYRMSHLTLNHCILAAYRPKWILTNVHVSFQMQLKIILQEWIRTYTFSFYARYHPATALPRGSIWAGSKKRVK